MRLIRTLMLDCEEVSRLTSQAMDEPLPWHKKMGMRFHTMMCKFCRQNKEQLDTISTMARQKQSRQQAESPPKLSDSTKDKLNQFLSESNESGPPE